MLQAFLRLAVHIPIEETNDWSDKSAISASAVQAILRVLREFDFAGSIGTYKVVVEISRGTETFVPTKASAPTHGETNMPSIVASARLVTYIPACTPSEEVDRMVDEVVSAHPWEHPVIEVGRVSLWMPS